MIAAARVILGREPEDDNEADALLIGAWAAAHPGANAPKALRADALEYHRTLSPASGFSSFCA